MENLIFYAVIKVSSSTFFDREIHVDSVYHD